MARLLLLLVVSLLVTFPSYGVDGQEEVPCQCVAPNLCADMEAAVDGQGLLDVRIHDKICDNFFEVCCENPIPEQLPPRDQLTYKGCGYQSPIGVVPRITSDSKTAGFAEHPWTVAVLLRDVAGERNIYKCGGSLIHPQVVLTAAHCIFEINPSLLSVRAGEWDTRSQEEPLPHQDRHVEDTLIHPKFKRGSLKNDISLVFFKDPFILTANVGLICLPPAHFKLESGLCAASGWGKNILKKGKHSTILRKVILPLVPRDKCEAALKKTRLGGFYKLHSSFICAGGEANKDTCKGDGGSPLVCAVPGVKDRFFQLGIVSWGIGCGESDVPGVYVNVPLFREWVDSEVSSRGLKTSFYTY